MKVLKQINCGISSDFVLQRTNGSFMSSVKVWTVILEISFAERHFRVFGLHRTVPMLLGVYAK